MRWLKVLLFLLGIMGCGLLFTGCKSQEADIKKLKDLEFTVVEDADVPAQLMEVINEKKKDPFKITYTNEGSLYIVVGYGQQPTGGYSIAVNDLFLTSNAIYIDTNLIGPSEKDFVANAITYPYVVIKTEYMDERVVFN